MARSGKLKGQSSGQLSERPLWKPLGPPLERPLGRLQGRWAQRPMRQAAERSPGRLLAGRRRAGRRRAGRWGAGRWGGRGERHRVRQGGPGPPPSSRWHCESPRPEERLGAPPVASAESAMAAGGAREASPQTNGDWAMHRLQRQAYWAAHRSAPRAQQALRHRELVAPRRRPLDAAVRGDWQDWQLGWAPPRVARVGGGRCAQIYH